MDNCFYIYKARAAYGVPRWAGEPQQAAGCQQDIQFECWPETGWRTLCPGLDSSAWTRLGKAPQTVRQL